MGPITDYVLIMVIIFYFWRGWNKGLTDMLLGPISIVAALGGGLWYYNQTQNMFYGLAIAVAGPVILRIIVWILQKLFGSENKKDKDDKKTSVFSPTSLIAACLNMVWGVFLFCSVLTITIILPMKNDYVQSAQKDIKASATFALMQDIAGKRLPEKPVSDETIKKWTKPIKGSQGF